MKKYYIWNGNYKLNNTKIRIGQKIRVDLYNMDITEIMELKNLEYKEFTEGHIETNKEGFRKIMYIEIVNVKTTKYKHKKEFTSKIEYSTYKELNINTNTNQIKYRYIDLTITSNSLENCENIWFNLYNYLKENISCKLDFVGCPTSEEKENGKYYYCDSLVIGNKEDFKEAKEIYKEWKAKYKIA